jgi:Transposase, Mutator family
VLQDAGWQRCRVHAKRNLLVVARHSNGLRSVISALISTIFVQPDRAAARAQLRAVAGHACASAGMPLMIEPLALEPDGGGYDSIGDVGRVVGSGPSGGGAARRRHQGRPDRRSRRLPPRGAGRRSGAGVAPRRRAGRRFARTRAMLDQGARGLVSGRNIFRHPAPAAMTRALLAMLHDDASAEQAGALLAEARFRP